MSKPVPWLQQEKHPTPPYGRMLRLHGRDAGRAHRLGICPFWPGSRAIQMFGTWLARPTGRG